MPKILIANVDNESMLGDRSMLTYEFCCHSAVAASKHIWFAEPGDIVVLPDPLSPEMHDYVAKVKRVSSDSIKVLTPARRNGEVTPLRSDELLGENLIERLHDSMEEERQWELSPYYYDCTTAALVKKLGLITDGRPFSFLEQGGVGIFNNKQIFRSLAIGRGVKVARGETVSTLAELTVAIENLMSDTGAVIVKQSRHSSCDGNIIVATNRNVNGQGAIDIVRVNRAWPIEKAAASLWQRLASATGECLVVEAYHPVSAICYAEYFIRSRAEAPDFLNMGEQRMEPTFAGFEIPGRIPSYQQARFVSGAAELARLAQDIGFTGLIDVDGIITDDGQVLFCEVNGRFGGCSHVHYLAEKLLRTGYGDTHTILTRNSVRAPLFDEVLQLIEDHELSLAAGQCEGILITAEDSRRSGRLDYLIAAEKRPRACEIERWFLDQLRIMLGSRHDQPKMAASYH